MRLSLDIFFILPTWVRQKVEHFKMSWHLFIVLPSRFLRKSPLYEPTTFGYTDVAVLKAVASCFGPSAVFQGQGFSSLSNEELGIFVYQANHCALNVKSTGS